MIHDPQCIVCEKSGNLASALRWHSHTNPFAMRETRSLILARAAVLESPASILVLETLAANAEGAMRLIQETRTTCPKSRAIVLLDQNCWDVARWFWEAGAVWVADSPRRMDRLVHCIQRHLANQEVPETTLRERIWARLPWPPVAS